MKIFLIFSIVIMALLFLGNKVIYSAKRNLFKDQEAWSGKDIKIKRIDSKDVSESKGNQNYLKMIANESKIYLENESNTEKE